MRRRWLGDATTRGGRRSAAPTRVKVNLTAGIMWASGAENFVSVMIWLDRREPEKATGEQGSTLQLHALQKGNRKRLSL